MPKMTVNIDTDAKEMSVQLNGNKVENVHGVSIYKSYKCCNEDEDNEVEYMVSISTYQEIDGVRTRVEYALEAETMAAEKKESAKAAKIDGFSVKEVVSDLAQQIRQWIQHG